MRLKHNANRAVVAGKRVILIDDSIVRGTTSVKIVQMVRDAGATRSAFPHLLAADHTSRLLRHRHAAERTSCSPRPIRSRRCAHCIGADTLAFLSIDGIYRAMGEERARHRCGRSSPTIASPAIIRRPLTDLRRRKKGRATVAAGRSELSANEKLMASRDFVSASSSSPARIALVTGASRGIGRAVALGLRGRARTSSRSPARQGALRRSSTTKSARCRRPARRWSRCDLADFDALDRLGAALVRALRASSIFWSAMPAMLGPLSPLGPCRSRRTGTR